MLEKLLQVHMELEDVNNSIIQRQKEYIEKLEQYVGQLESTIFEFKTLIDSLSELKTKS